MTTPAINVDMGQNTPNRVRYLFSDGSSAEELGFSFSRWHSEQRPASISNPKSASGWRSPSGWYHSVRSSTPQPSANFVQRFPPGFFILEKQFLDGAGWNSSMSDIDDYDESMVDAAVIKALSKLKGQNVNLAVAFAERAETARLFSDVIGRIAKSVRAFRAKNPKKIWDAVKKEGGAQVPLSWLELQYGWKPLQQDVFGATKALNDRERDGDAYSASVTGVSRKNVNDVWRKTSSISGDIGLRVARNKQQIAKVHLDYNLENPLVATLAQLGITNPIELVWEKLPYSFVVDWAVPVGNYLSAMDAALGWSFKGGTKTVVRKLDERAAGWSILPDASQAGYSAFGPPVFHNRLFYMLREVYSSSPLPRFPGIKNPLSTGHIANAMSLLVSALR